MKLIVGLGNPTAKYEKTYHNLGFMTVEALALMLGVKIKTKECDAMTAVTSVRGEQIVLAKPQTYMNLSGSSVKQLMKKYGAKSGDLVVVYDDADIEMSKLRIRREGSAGTHNGMRNIVSEIETTEFARFRIGMKYDEEIQNFDIKGKVLSRISAEDGKLIFPAVAKAAEALLFYVRGQKDLDTLMRELN